jgi:hypothetical protein
MRDNLIEEEMTFSVPAPAFEAVLRGLHPWTFVFASRGGAFRIRRFTVTRTGHLYFGNDGRRRLRLKLRRRGPTWEARLETKHWIGADKVEAPSGAAITGWPAIAEQAQRLPPLSAAFVKHRGNFNYVGPDGERFKVGVDRMLAFDAVDPSICSNIRTDLECENQGGSLTSEDFHKIALGVGREFGLSPLTHGETKWVWASRWKRNAPLLDRPEVLARALETALAQLCGAGHLLRPLVEC